MLTSLRWPAALAHQLPAHTVVHRELNVDTVVKSSQERLLATHHQLKLQHVRGPDLERVGHHVPQVTRAVGSCETGGGKIGV